MQLSSRGAAEEEVCTVEALPVAKAIVATDGAAGADGGELCSQLLLAHSSASLRLQHFYVWCFDCFVKFHCTVYCSNLREHRIWMLLGG